MPRATPRSHTPLLVFVALAALAALLLWKPSREPHEATPDESQSHTSGSEEVEEQQPPAAPQSGPAAADPECAPHAEQACREGNVWWFDSCGEPQAIAENCEGRACLGDRCAVDPRCAQVSEYGVCEGDTAVACIAGRVLRVDCGAKGQRCVDTREGARCLPRDPVRGCGPRDLPRCQGDRLRECVDGLWAEIDCAARRAACITDGDGARCGPSAPGLPRLPELDIELCGAGDEDKDGNVDEAGACEPVPLVAFVPEGAQLTDFEARHERELDGLNRAFAPLRFRWAKTVQIAASYRDFHPDRILRAAGELALRESRLTIARAKASGVAAEGGDAGLPFYVPILYVEKLRMEPPKSGLSTLPNSECGGVRISDAPSPPYGLVVLADQRTPETLTHELGHYLGLCHTHDELERIAATAADLPICNRTGDGICDTPLDPGPDQCQQGEGCDYYCPARAARPDASNLMSYYMMCRHAFTPEQIAEASRVLALRRGWFRCLNPEDCPCDPALENPCPAAMSCHPAAAETQPWTCELEGPGMPGTACRGSGQCVRGTICLGTDRPGSGRCTRLCASSAQCRCIAADATFRVCAEDIQSL